jgi:hypothetical protein
VTALNLLSFEHYSSAPIEALEHERDSLKAAVRAELAAVRRGEGSMHVADDLSQRLNTVESRLVHFLAGLLQR